MELPSSIRTLIMYCSAGVRSRIDRKRRDGEMRISWTHDKPLAWDVMVSDTYTQANIGERTENAGRAATKAAVNKTTKYTCHTMTHHFIPIAIETDDPLNTEAAQLVADLGKITSHSRTFGNPISFSKTFSFIAERK